MPLQLFLNSGARIFDRIKTGDPRTVAAEFARADRWGEHCYSNALALNLRKGECIDLLIPLVSSRNDVIRRSVVLAFLHISSNTPKHAEAVKALAERLKDPDHWIRQRAAEALVYWADAAATDALVAGLDDSDHQVQWACALALAKLGDLRGVGAVEPTTLSTHTTDLKYYLPPDALAPYYVQMLSRHNSIGYTGLMQMANDPVLRRFTGPVIEPLIELLGRWQATDGRENPEDIELILSAIGGEEVAQKIWDCYISERDQNVRASMQHVIARLRLTSGSRYLVAQAEILADESLPLRLRAIAAEGLILAGQMSVAHTLASILQQLGQSESKEERLLAIYSYPTSTMDLSDAEYIGRLIASCEVDVGIEWLLRLAEQDGAGSPGAVVVLGGYVDLRAVRMLLALIGRSPDSHRAKLAAEALSRIYSRSDLSAAARKLIDDSRDLRVGEKWETFEEWTEVLRENDQMWTYVHPESRIRIPLRLGDYLAMKL